SSRPCPVRTPTSSPASSGTFAPAIASGRKGSTSATGPRRPRPRPGGAGAATVPRFVGTFRAGDREWGEGLDLGDRLELHPYLPRRSVLELQRDSEALLLLIPESGGRGPARVSEKGFQYPA